MFVTSRFVSSAGVPHIGLSPTICIFDLYSNVKIVVDAPMLEVGEGWYKYSFDDADLCSSYVAHIDGGIALPLDERFREGAIDMTPEFIEQVEKGRWRIVNNQMVFYRVDNVTPLMTFNLFDSAGDPVSDNAAERVPV